jgi:hypothetical protein
MAASAASVKRSLGSRVQLMSHSEVLDLGRAAGLTDDLGLTVSRGEVTVLSVKIVDFTMSCVEVTVLSTKFLDFIVSVADGRGANWWDRAEAVAGIRGWRTSVWASWGFAATMGTRVAAALGDGEDVGTVGGANWGSVAAAVVRYSRVRSTGPGFVDVAVCCTDVMGLGAEPVTMRGWD